MRGDDDLFDLQQWIGSTRYCAISIRSDSSRCAKRGSIRCARRSWRICKRRRAALQTQVEQNDDGFEAAFVGRQGIAGVDEGRSAGDVQAQYASFDAFLLAIERWAQAKEGLYGIEEIDAYAVAANVWSKGTVLYREGGGTEILFDLLQPAVDDIDRQLSEQLDRSVFTMLNETISDYA